MTAELDQTVIEQLAEIRKTGRCNMLDRGCVKRTAKELEFTELRRFIDEEDSKAYMDHLKEMGRQR